MNAQARTSISRLIDNLSTPQDDDQTNGATWKPTAAKLVDLELKYTSPPAAALSDSCRPWNYDDYLNRLATFRESSRWFAKPACLSPLQCALLGWSCDLSKRDWLVCQCCKATLAHSSSEDASGEALRAQLATGHAMGCGWGYSGKEVDLGRAPTMCSPSFADIPGVQSAWKLSEYVVTRMTSLVGILLSSASPPNNPSLSLRGLLSGQAGSRNVTLPREISTTELASLQQQLQELERHLRSSAGRTGAAKAMWLQSEGARAVSSAVSWLLQSEEIHQNNDGATQSENLMRALLVIALSGWSAPMVAPIATQGATDATPRAVCCHLCGRAVSLRTSAELELLSQHRYFCTVINAQSEVPTWLSLSTTDKLSANENTNGKESSVVLGWECNLKAVASIFRSELTQQREVTPVPSADAEKALASPGQKHALTTSVAESSTSSTNSASNECGDVSPEQAYKRIRSVLAMAAANRS
eukprot:gene23014-26067_t